MGTPKALLPWEGRPLVRAHAEALARVADTVVVVVGAEAGGIRAALHGLGTVENPGWERGGMIGSVRVGLAALGPPDLTLVTPVDVPPASLWVLSRLLAATPPAVPLATDGTPGHPVLLDARTVARILDDPPSGGLRDLLGDATLVPTSDPTIALDFDDPAAFERAVALCRNAARLGRLSR